MEHFAAVVSIVRAGLANDRTALEKQVGRLRARLEKDGDHVSARTLDRLLRADAEARNTPPSGIQLSQEQIGKERLTPETHPPLDRETGAQLCSIDFFDDIAPSPIVDPGAEDMIEAMLAEWTNADALRDVGVTPTRSLLIFGPPGSGKTLTARHLASRLGLPLLTARIDGLISSFLGTTARNIANFFEFANRHACLLLLDEFDAIAKIRDDPREIGEIKRVVNTLLQNLDKRRDHGITIAITNHDRLLDPAVWRRFETQVHMGEPGPIARGAMIERFLQPLNIAEGTREVFSHCLRGWSGADLERICIAVKRTLALSGDGHDSPSLFRALAVVLSRMPSLETEAARFLAADPDMFISFVANDPEFRLTQKDLAAATGYHQSRISDLKKIKRHIVSREMVNA